MATYCRKRLKEVYENVDSLNQHGAIMLNSETAIGSLQKLVDTCEVNDNMFNLKNQ